jgi:hypothetical protein
MGLELPDTSRHALEAQPTLAKRLSAMIDPLRLSFPCRDIRYDIEMARRGKA